MKRKSYVWREEWSEAIKDLEPLIRLEVREAVDVYALSGELPTLKTVSMLAFNFIKPSIDRDIEKYISITERNRENGKKGGRGKNPEEPKKPTGFFGNPEEPKKAERDSDSDTSNEVKKDNPIGLSKKQIDFENRKKVFGEECAKFVDTYGKVMVREFYDYWTEPNKSKTKMAFELKKTWDLSRRLSTWANNDFSKSRKQVQNETKQYKKLD